MAATGGSSNHKKATWVVPFSLVLSCSLDSLDSIIPEHLALWGEGSEREAVNMLENI